MATTTRPQPHHRGPQPQRSRPNGRDLRVARPAPPYHLRRGAVGPDGEYLRNPRSPFAIFSPSDGNGRRHVTGRGTPDIGLLVIATVATLLILWLARAGWNATRVHVGMTGFRDHQPVTQSEGDHMVVRLSFPSVDQMARASLSFDGRNIHDEAKFATKTLTWSPPSLAEGAHHLTVKVPRALLPSSTITWDFIVDATPPKISVPSFVTTPSITAPAVATGHLDPTATLSADGHKVPTHRGTFTLRYKSLPSGPILLRAVDPAGNTSTASVLFRPAYVPGLKGVHGVHVTAIAWANKTLHDGIVSLIDRGLIDTVELDLKDEAGVIGYDSQLPQAKAIGAVQTQYNLRDALTYFKSRNIHVIGRIVAFRDPIFARWAWDNGHREEVVQTPDGKPYSPAGYGPAAFTNYTDPAVDAYNIAIAKEAAQDGLNDIVWDYIRRPEGDPSTMVVPGLTGTNLATWQAIVGFLKSAQSQLRPLGVYEGASIFGISSLAPDSIGQRPAEMAKYLDYLSPMVYPAAWTKGVFGVVHPNAQPYDIVKASLTKFQQVTGPTGIPYVPWLQGYSLGIHYGPQQLDDQIRAGSELGITNYLIWNAVVSYGAVEGGLSPHP